MNCDGKGILISNIRVSQRHCIITNYCTRTNEVIDRLSFDKEANFIIVLWGCAHVIRATSLKLWPGHQYFTTSRFKVWVLDYPWIFELVLNMLFLSCPCLLIKTCMTAFEYSRSKINTLLNFLKGKETGRMSCLKVLKLQW